MQKAVLSNEFEDSGWIRDEEHIFWVFFKYKPKALLLLRILSRGLLCRLGVAVGWLFDFGLVK